MNPANFPTNGVGGVMPQADRQKVEGGNAMLQKHVSNILQSQGPFSGWREMVQVTERVFKIVQMISSLRLIPGVEPASALNAALKFEEKAFKEASQKSDYERECNQKLIQLRNKRQQAALAQGNPQAGMPMNPQNQAQLQHMFANGIPRQAPGHPMGLSPAHLVGLPLGQQPHQLGPAFPPNPQDPRNPGIIRDELSSLPPKELELVRKTAQQIKETTLEGDMKKIQINLENMTADQRQFLASKGWNPLDYFFQCQAWKNIKRRRILMQQQRMANAQNPNMNPANQADANRMMAAHQRQISQPVMGYQGSPAMPMVGLASPFPGSVDLTQPQKSDPLHLPDGGRPGMSGPPQQRMHQPFHPRQPGFPGPQANANRANMNPALLAQQQHQQNLQNTQQEKLQQAARFQAQSDAQARAQAAAKAQQAISNQANAAIPQTLPQQSPAMSMMGQPGGVQIPPGMMGGRGRPYPRPPGMDENPGVIQTPRPGIPGMQNSRPGIVPGLPPALQAQLAHLAPDQVHSVLQNYRRQLNNNPMLRQGLPMQPNASDPLAMQQMPGSHVMDPNMRQGMGMHYPMSNFGGMQSQPGLQGPQFSQQKPPQQAPGFGQQDPRLQLLIQRSASISMTEDQQREMDRVMFPPNMLNSNPAIAQSLPKSLKSWGQLKVWATSNPQTVGDFNIEKLSALQRLHFGQLAGRAARSNQNNNAAGGMGQNAMGQAAFGQGPHEMPQMGQTIPGQSPMSMPTMRQITAEDLKYARRKLGAQVANLQDDALKVLLEKNRQKQMVRNAQANAQAFANQSNQGLAMGTTAAPPHTPQVVPATQASQAPLQVVPPTATPTMPVDITQPPQSMATTAATPAPVSMPMPTPPMRSSPKKRPNEAGAETEAPVPQQPEMPANTLAGRQARQYPPAFREKLSKMSPQQRAQWEARMRQAQQQPRISKDAADEAWGRLPDRFKQLYAEMIRKDTATVPVQMVPEEKAIAGQLLRENIEMLSRMDSLIPWVATQSHDKAVAGLLQMRMLLMKQFKGPDWTLADHFTISRDYIHNSLEFIKKWFSEMIKRAPRPNQAGKPGVAQPVPPGPAAAKQAAQPAPPKATTPLNASNLQQLEQQEAAIQRSKKNNSTVPPAPTTMQPPFPIGAASPQGVPRVYGPASVTQENLTLPPPKKRKVSQPAAARAAAKATQQLASVVQEESSPVLAGAKKPAAPKNMFKCTVSDCQHQLKGFPTKAALDKHVGEQHKPEEPITDAFEYFAEGSKIGLGLNKKPEDGKGQKPASLATPGASNSNAGPNTPASQAMAQQVSSTAGLMGSASNFQLKQSQRSSAKDLGMTPSAMKVSERPPSPDPWETSPTSLEAIRAAFKDISSDSYMDIGDDPVNELLLSNAFRSKSTPRSSDASAVSQTPQDSCMSKDEIENAMEIDDKDLPSGWADLSEDLEYGLFMDEPWLKFDWDGLKANDLEYPTHPENDVFVTV